MEHKISFGIWFRQVPVTHNNSCSSQLQNVTLNNVVSSLTLTLIPCERLSFVVPVTYNTGVMPSEKPTADAVANGSSPPQQEKPKLRPCCACPETKKARDECIIERGEENCGDLIEKHKQCMRDLGFKI